MHTNVRKHINIILACVFILNLLVFLPSTVKSESNALKLHVTNAINAKIVSLDWYGDYGSNSRFKIQVRENSGSFIDISEYLDASTSEYTHILQNYSSSSLYCYRVAIYSYNNVLSGYTNEVYLPVDGIINPTNIEVKALSARDVCISWNYPDYKYVKTIIERKLGNETYWNIIATIDEGVNQFIDSGLPSNSYYTYRIKSVLGQNLYSDYVTSTSVLTMLNEPTVSSAKFIAPQEVHLSWNDIWSDNVYIDIEKKSGNNEFILVHTVTSQSQTSWIDEEVVTNSTYIYRVKAKSPDSSATSNYSNETAVTCIILDTPISLTSSAVSSSEINLSWIDNTLNESGYELWRRTGESGSWEKYADIPSYTHIFTDTGIFSNTVYYYRVRSYLSYSNVYSSFSNDTWAKTTPPDAGILLDYSITASSYVKLEWKLEYNKEDNLILSIEKLSSSDTNWKLLSSTSIGSNYYIDYNANSYEKYYYRIKLLNLRNNSVKYSSEIAVTPGAPAAPFDLELILLSPNSIKLQWKDKAINEDGFIIERMLPAYGYFFEIDKVDSNSNTYIENDLIPEELYYYRVRSFNKSGSSGYSNEVYTLPHTLKTFDDLGNHSWAKEAIENLSNRGVIKGKTDNQFSPDDQITRAEFVSLVIRSFNLSRTPVGYLIDVAPSDWYYKDVMTAKNIGIISADDGYFDPDSPITREYIAIIIYKTLNTINKPLPSHDTRILDGYLDKELITPYALPYMASLKGEKIIDGRSSTILAPKDTATRAEAAVILNRIIDR